MIYKGKFNLSNLASKISKHLELFIKLKLKSSQPSQQQEHKMLQIEEDVDVQLLREREQAIQKIESDIVEVNQIFKDLASVVHDQGEVIDSIEANIESTGIQIQEGTQQLFKASDYSVMRLWID